MHKILKDYLQTSRGDLLLVVKRIKEMVLNQYNKYQKDIASARLTIKRQHKEENMPYLPPDIHEVVTRSAIELVRQQDLINQDILEKRKMNLPCTGVFKTIYGLPCRHTIQSFNSKERS
jgi:hypothetical protein